MFRKLFWMLREPEAFFEAAREEGYREPLMFLLQISGIIAFFTPLVNYLGWESTDMSSSYQAQIIAWRYTKGSLLPQYGYLAYLLEGLLIIALAVVIALFLTLFLHLIFRAMGGRGALLNAWKATCYGAGPCVLLGWLPYWSLLVGAYSLVLQLYFAPKSLYRLKESRALMILAFFVGSTLLEFATKGTTVGF